MKGVALALLCLTAPAALAQPPARAMMGDTRIQNIEFKSNQTIHLATALGTTQIILLEEGEHIQSAILSDPAAYSITLSASGSSLTIRPNGPAKLTTLKIGTGVRNYDIELDMAPAGAAPELVRFAYATKPAGSGNQRYQIGAEGAALDVTWRFSGNKVLRPSSISDDGQKTYIAWPQDQAMPAVFAVGLGGGEEMVEGYMREGMFTMDRVYDALVFRIDRRIATVRRVVKTRGRPHG